MVIGSSIVILHQVDGDMVGKDLRCFGKLLQLSYSEAHFPNAVSRKVQSSWIWSSGEDSSSTMFSFLLLILDRHLVRQLDTGIL
jgi:hypothetical protein